MASCCLHQAELWVTVWRTLTVNMDFLQFGSLWGWDMKLRAILVLWLAGLLAGGAVLAEPVAMVTDVSGGVSAMEKGKTRKILLLSYLEPDMTLQLDSNAHLTVTFFSKPVEYRFTGPAKLTVEHDRILSGDGKAETHAVSLQKTSAAQKFTVAQRESVAQAAFEMRAGRPGLRLDDPVDTSLIGADALIFSWDGPRPMGGYQLSLYDNHNQLLHQQASLTSNSWAPSAGLLKADNTYEWEIKAALENGEVLTARGKFGVADSATAQSIQAQSPPAGSAFSDRVLHAVFLEEKGFKYDARRLWKELAKERPDNLVAREHSTR